MNAWRGDRLADLLRRLDISVKGMSRLLNVDHRRICGVLTGRELPPAPVVEFWDRLERAAEALPDASEMRWPYGPEHYTNRTHDFNRADRADADSQDSGGAGHDPHGARGV